MWTHPGKKLLFMGGEIAQNTEWNHDASLSWYLLDQQSHAGVQALVRDLNRLYRRLPALHVNDGASEGFRWVVRHDQAQSVFAYLRQARAEDPPVLVVCNVTPVPRFDYRLGVPRPGYWREVCNSDAALYGGSNLGNGGRAEAVAEPWGEWPARLSLTLPPLATLIFAAA